MVASIKTSSSNLMKKVIFVQGPTGAGKSHWALEQAKKNPSSCIVNCDSVQIYKHVDIGSNKPSPEEMALLPHYLYSHVEFPGTITAGQYERLFFSTIEKLKENIVFVVGGTGFYFQSIENGMYPVNAIRDEVKEEFHQLARDKGFEYLYDWIESKDPEHAQKLSRNDHYRIERAFQLMRSENKSITQIQKEFQENKRSFPYPLLKIGVTEEKEALRDIITARTSKLLKMGLIEEVETLLSKGMGGWDPLNSVGYKEVVHFLSEPSSDRLALKNEIVQNTMKLIKKQKTWFQKDKDIVWLKFNDTQTRIVEHFIAK